MWFLALLFASVAQAALFPPDGGYVVFQNKVIQTLGEKLEVEVADMVNAYRDAPDVHGDAGGASYTFSKFVFDSSIQGFYWSGTYPALDLGFTEVSFILQFDYSVRQDSWPHASEHGWIQVYTTAKIKVEMDTKLDFSGPKVVLSATDVKMVFNQGDVIIHVQCTSSVCIIPVDDLAKAVAKEFVPTFESTVQKGFNAATTKMLANAYTTIKIPDIPSMDLVLTGQWVAAGSPPNFAVAVSGAFTPDPTKKPPFSPTFSPPDSLFTSPSSPMTVIVTDYALHSAAWAAYTGGDIDITVTNAMIPKDSPIHMTTDDDFFLQGVPGLSKYPHELLQLRIQGPGAKYPSVNVSSQGVGFQQGVLGMTWSVVANGSSSAAPGWTQTLTYDATLGKLLAKADKQQIWLNGSLVSGKGSVTTTSSSVGNVTDAVFNSLVQLILAGISDKSVGVHFIMPSMFTVKDLKASSADHYVLMEGDVEYNVNPDGTVCGTQGVICPVDTTCCADWKPAGCCPLPDAVCCGAGCCMHGCVCDGGQCRC